MKTVVCSEQARVIVDLRKNLIHIFSTNDNTGFYRRVNIIKGDEHPPIKYDLMKQNERNDFDGYYTFLAT